VDLAQVGLDSHRGPARDDGGSHPRAAQVARQPQVHAPGREPQRQLGHLRATLLRQPDVRAAEVADARGAVGLTVSDEQDLPQAHE
jgi:hypothetical protein